uniref:Uncharacterized protein n=1 Tax=Picea glauca TaxID=3330 RepID=A0A101M1D8_PICGL|nr:hypothetical protein ABT39_MTgene3813 [Picea glauca]QHR87326.1 hypothetical protein Q903MT_gene1336 [Picea sitchensis]
MHLSLWLVTETIYTRNYIIYFILEKLAGRSKHLLLLVVLGEMKWNEAVGSSFPYLCEHILSSCSCLASLGAGSVFPIV